MGRFVSAWEILAILALLIAISAGVVVARAIAICQWVGSGFWARWVPMVGILQPAQQGSADRFVYEAYLGLFIIVCWGMADLARQRHVSRAWLASASAAALLALTVVSNRQIGCWKDGCTLWKQAAEANKYNWVAQDNVAGCLQDQGKPLEAKEHFLASGGHQPRRWLGRHAYCLL